MKVLRHSRILAALPITVACSAPADNDDNAVTGPMLTVGKVTTVPGGGDGTMSVVTLPAGASETSGSSGALIVDNGPVDESAPTNIEECGAVGQPTSVNEVVLAFVFDVSASMGSHQEPYFSRELKWDPVVAATKAFFEDPASEGISATLTFFPNDQAPLTGADGALGVIGALLTGSAVSVCDPGAYTQPDVGRTELPSGAFASAIDAITPATDADWRLGTPTLAALQGTLDAIAEMKAADPNTSYSIVLVTDGMPALCGGAADSVSTVEAAVAAVADEVATYVIGVDNPATTANQNPPDTVSDLNAVSRAGGTGDAFLIDTDDPETTASTLAAVIETIKDKAFECEMAIPEPPEGEVFDPLLVNVAFTGSSGTETIYEYDPVCASDLGWHFNDEANPGSIVLCGSACDGILADAERGAGQLNVKFGCNRNVPPRAAQ
jgi:hypothetical protein